VSIARMKYIGDSQTVLLRPFGNALEDFRQAAARNGAIHAIVVRSDSAHCREGRLAPSPEPATFGGIARYIDAVCTPRDGQRLYLLHSCIEFIRIAVQFAQKDRGGIAR